MHQLILFLYKTGHSETEDRFLIIGQATDMLVKDCHNAFKRITDAFMAVLCFSNT